MFRYHIMSNQNNKKASETDAFSHSQYINVIVTKEYPSFALYGSAL